MDDHANSMTILPATLENWLPGISPPQRVLVIGDTQGASLCLPPGLSVTHRSYDEPGGSESFDLGIVYRVLETLDAGRAAEILGRLRNQYCRGIVTISGLRQNPLDDEAMRALEFTSQAPLGSHEVYSYHIDLYNETRDWNNAENWAHPKNFRRR